MTTLHAFPDWTIYRLERDLARQGAKANVMTLNVGNRLSREIKMRIGQGKEVRVDEIAAELARMLREKSAECPGVFLGQYDTTDVAYDPKNSAPPEELGARTIARFVSGTDFLLAHLNREIETINPEELNVAVYVRDHTCPLDEGAFNDKVLVTEMSTLELFEHCAHENISRPCYMMGRTGALLQLAD
ncbi:MAG: hypothetical protein ABIE94_02925 [archaeon]